MPPHYRTAPGAIFDVKPVDETGSVDVQKISSVQKTVNLTSFRPKKQVKRAGAVSKTSETFDRAEIAEVPIQKSSLNQKQEVLPPFIDLPSQEHIKQQFEELINHDLDLGVELAEFSEMTISLPLKKPKLRGRGIASSSTKTESKYRVIEASLESVQASNTYAPLLEEIHRSAAAISRQQYTDPDVIVEPTLAVASVAALAPSLELSPAAASDVRDFYTAQAPVIELAAHKAKPKRGSRIGRAVAFGTGSSRKSFRISKKLIIGSVIVLGLVGLLVRYGFHVKRNIMEQSSAAVTNLETAHDDLKTLDFKNASQDFFSAFANFSKAGNSLNVFGASITGLIADLPGAGTLKSAQNLVKVGQLLSAAGTSMTTALNAVSRTGALSDPTNPEVPIGPIVTALKKALIASQQQVAQASSLMADIDGSIIPEDKRASFDDLKSKMPEFQTAMDMSTDYAKFFENLINAQGYKRYLIMFQNASELRPTGGFPGTYGVVSFKDGKLDNLFVDDVYNLDGQIKQQIVPPLQMQHITPTWGMRDANWYVDFPTSAKNIENFYKKEADQQIDGVMVINPQMIQKILAIVGPVEMPQYHLTLTADNVLTTIQDQVEYGSNRAQPKQIVKDFAPLLLAKIYAAGSDKWLAIFNTLILSMNQRDVLMQFNDLSLESFVTDKGFGGQIHQGPEDYLMAVITNIKGSKTDAVTNTSLNVETKFEGADAIHAVTITRTHTGGSAKFGFYNKQNPAYVRVLVPEGAELVSISGNDKPNFKPLIDYSKGFVRDDQLVKFETSGLTDSVTGVTTYRESGKGEFGFWLITDAGKTKTVTLTYRVPKALKDLPTGQAGKTYNLYIQKQPALKLNDFKFSLISPDGLIPVGSYPLLTQQDSTFSYSSALENDLPVKVNFK